MERGRLRNLPYTILQPLFSFFFGKGLRIALFPRDASNGILFRFSSFLFLIFILLLVFESCRDFLFVLIEGHYPKAREVSDAKPTGGSSGIPKSQSSRALGTAKKPLGLEVFSFLLNPSRRQNRRGSNRSARSCAPRSTPPRPITCRVGDALALQATSVANQNCHDPNSAFHS